MTEPAGIERVLVMPEDPADDICVHVVCCQDGDRTLCGMDADGVEWAEFGDAFTCADCIEADEHDVCPLNGKCQECPS